MRPGRTLTELLLCGLCGHRPQSHHHGAAGDESKWEKGDGFDVRLPSFAMKLLTWGWFCCCFFFSDGPKNRERRTASKHAFFSCVCLGLAQFENIDIAFGKRIFSMHQTANLVSKWSARVSIPVVSGQKVAPEANLIGFSHEQTADSIDGGWFDWRISDHSEVGGTTEVLDQPWDESSG